MLTIALAKGKLFEDELRLLAQIGYPLQLAANERRLLIETQKARFLLARGADVSTFVEHGVADFGVVGKDVLMETSPDVMELLDLGFGFCYFALAQKQGETLPPQPRIATKFTHVAEQYFKEAGISPRLIHLHGSVELAATVGLADGIVDLVQTGTTLRENGLSVTEKIATSTARLIANPVAYRLKYEEMGRFYELVRTQRESDIHVAKT